jgi:hypothetical protein
MKKKNKKNKIATENRKKKENVSHRREWNQNVYRAMRFKHGYTNFSLKGLYYIYSHNLKLELKN